MGPPRSQPQPCRSGSPVRPGRGGGVQSGESASELRGRTRPLPASAKVHAKAWQEQVPCQEFRWLEEKVPSNSGLVPRV